GKVKLDTKLKEPPQLLKDLITNEHHKSMSFIDNIRRYNSMFAFTSMGGKVDDTVNYGRGPFCYRIHGENYHRVDSDGTPKNTNKRKVNEILDLRPTNIAPLVDLSIRKTGRPVTRQAMTQDLRNEILNSKKQAERSPGKDNNHENTLEQVTNAIQPNKRPRGRPRIGEIQTCNAGQPVQSTPRPRGCPRKEEISTGLLSRYRSHINIEWCDQIGSIKYLFKYINKRPDRVTIAVDDKEIDEIKDFYDCRHLSAYEAAWRIYGFEIHYRTPPIERLPFHLPDKQTVILDATESIDYTLEKSSVN
nr:hypothetical protein [Tanacetum cinerariifolium]